MAFVFRTLALIPTALRIGVAGGAAYGTAKVGVWSDSTESREKLEQINQAVQKEIHYPRGGAYPFSSESEKTSVASRPVQPIATSGVKTSSIQSAKDTWNAGIMKACKTIATADGSELKAATVRTYQRASDYFKK